MIWLDIRIAVIIFTKDWRSKVNYWVKFGLLSKKKH